MADADCRANRPCKKCGLIERDIRGNCKACKRAYDAARHANNPEKHRADTVKWLTANPGKTRYYSAKWRAENKEKVSADKSRWRRNNKDKEAARISVYRALNRGKTNATMAAWRKLNPNVARIHNHNRRSRKGNVASDLSKGLAEKLFKLQRGKCPCCGLPLGGNYHMDHKMPLALGGLNTDDNIQLLRKRCNLQKHSKHPVDFMQERGFLL